MMENFQKNYNWLISDCEACPQKIGHAKNISIQHPLAAVELVAWDSGCTLFISKEDELVNKFRKEFPLSVDLEMYNKGVLDDSDAYEKWLKNQK